MRNCAATCLVVSTFFISDFAIMPLVFVEAIHQIYQHSDILQQWVDKLSLGEYIFFGSIFKPTGVIYGKQGKNGAHADAFGCDQAESVNDERQRTDSQAKVHGGPICS